MTTQIIISNRNVRYITGNSQKVEGKTVKQNMLIFAETKEILEAVIARMSIRPSDEKVTEHKSPKYHGWDISRTPFSRTFTTQTRQDFQKHFKAAKKAGMLASKIALKALADTEKSKIADLAKSVAEAAKVEAPKKDKKDKKAKAKK